MAWINNNIIGILFIIVSIGCAIGFWNSDDMSNSSDNYFWNGIFTMFLGIILLLPLN